MLIDHDDFLSDCNNLPWFQTTYIYHLESRWRNSHLLVYHSPLQIATVWEWLAIYFHYGVTVLDFQDLALKKPKPPRLKNCGVSNPKGDFKIYCLQIVVSKYLNLRFTNLRFTV